MSNPTTAAHDPLAPSISVSREGATATVLLDRPERRNAIDSEGWDRLRAIFDDLARDDSVRAVVLTGAGGNFCAGADLGGTRREEHPLARMRRVGDVALALVEMPKPVIAQVAGSAIGAGWNLALACDLVVADTSARFSQIFARRGLSVDFGGTWLLPRLVGLQQAKRLTMLAETIGAEEARQLGLVTWVCAEGDLPAFVSDLAGRLAAQPPLAVAQTKSLLHQGTRQSLADALEGEARAQAVNLATEDAPAAFRAFLDKSAPPAFTGRWAVR
ncbi:enoyl-CoA hydratase/isomerase family protein [Nocardioides sp. L-11A]|uniref:enoyl-CoA hydratase/isomerase family protein n=1 Tax=Nocardioides sp. L-11A TaxID=3043848 RepID=UPI00249B9B7B|nr:enoyl-CoA hydratase-related protein [Nocardioides sp. L-11A]